MKIAIVANKAWYIANFRLSLMEALREENHEVVAISPAGEEVCTIAERGFSHHTFNLSGRGTNPLRELRSVMALRRLLKDQAIELVLSYTPKGNLYSAFARKRLRIFQVANVSGLGSSFIANDWLTKLMTVFYRAAFKDVSRVFFQNEDDRQVFLRQRLVKSTLTDRLPGSGVDLVRFAPAKEAGREDHTNAGPIFLLIARLLGDKGIREYATAARIVKKTFPSARCQLLGDAQADNPTVIDSDELAQWVASGDVEYLGYQTDVRPFIERATCVVLPSYREGMPRTLLEAAAMAKPLIATDVPGCRDTLEEGVNGYLCQVRNSESLAQAMLKMAGLPTSVRLAMGQRSRQKMELEFSERVVIEKYIKTVNSLMSQNRF